MNLHTGESKTERKRGSIPTSISFTSDYYKKKERKKNKTENMNFNQTVVVAYCINLLADFSLFLLDNFTLVEC